MWGEQSRAETDLKFSFTFSIAVLTHASTWGPSLQLRVWAWDSFSEHTPKWGPQFSTVFTLSWPPLNLLSLSCRVRTPIISSSDFYPGPTQRFSRLNLLQSIRTCCRFAADTFLSLTRASLIILLGWLHVYRDMVVPSYKDNVWGKREREREREKKKTKKKKQTESLRERLADLWMTQVKALTVGQLVTGEWVW